MSEKKPTVGERLEALCEKWIEELESESLPASRITAIDALIRLTDFANSYYKRANDKVDYEGLAYRVAEILVEKVGELPTDPEYPNCVEDPNVEGLDPAPIPPMPKVERITFQVFPKKLEARKETGELLWVLRRPDKDEIHILEPNGNGVTVSCPDPDTLIVEYVGKSGQLLQTLRSSSPVGLVLLTAPVQEGSQWHERPRRPE